MKKLKRIQRTSATLIKLHTFHSKKIKKKNFNYNDLKIWLKLSLWGSGISVILGFLIYKSFFILAAFLPPCAVGVWHFIKKTEKQIQKFDVFLK